MSSHAKRIFNRQWQREHIAEIRRVVEILNGPKRFEMAMVLDGTIVMYEKRFAAFGIPGERTTAYWRQLLRDRGVLA